MHTDKRLTCIYMGQAAAIGVTITLKLNINVNQLTISDVIYIVLLLTPVITLWREVVAGVAWEQVSSLGVHGS